MVVNTPIRKVKYGLFSFLIDVLIDTALIGMGVLLYRQFMVEANVPVTLSPVLTSMVGGFNNAVYVISGVPFVVGMLSMINTIGKVLKGVFSR